MDPSLDARTVEWMSLVVHLPVKESIVAGILLVDCATNKLYVRLADKLEGGDDAFEQMWKELAEDLKTRAEEMGASGLLETLEIAASHVLQLGPRNRISTGGSVEEMVNHLYQQHVLKTQPIKTAAIPETGSRC